MTSMARRTLSVTAAVTGMAALGAGFAGTACAGEPTVHNSDSMRLASVDGFATESMVPTNQLSTDFANSLTGTGSQKTSTASPTDGLTGLGQTQGFTFEMPPMSFGTAGEQEFDQTGLAPTMTPVMTYAVPAIIGTDVRTAAAEDQTFGSGNGLPQPIDGPANDAASPATGSVMPATAATMGIVSNSTTNDDTTSNHEFQV